MGPALSALFPGRKLIGIDRSPAMLAEAAATREPRLIDCRIDIDENVLPIVPPGKSIEEQIMEVSN